jgi:hypothetical protein
VDNLQETSISFSDADIMNGSLTKHLIPSANHSFVSGIHHTKSKKVANNVTSPNQHTSSTKNYYAMLPSLQELTDGRKKFQKGRDLSHSNYC